MLEGEGVEPSPLSLHEAVSKIYRRDGVGWRLNEMPRAGLKVTHLDTTLFWLHKLVGKLWSQKRNRNIVGDAGFGWKQ